jgi:hypothetical protein
MNMMRSGIIYTCGVFLFCLVNSVASSESEVDALSVRAKLNLHLQYAEGHLQRVPMARKVYRGIYAELVEEICFLENGRLFQNYSGSERQDITRTILGGSIYEMLKGEALRRIQFSEDDTKAAAAAGFLACSLFDGEEILKHTAQYISAPFYWQNSILLGLGAIESPITVNLFKKELSYLAEIKAGGDDVADVLRALRLSRSGYPETIIERYKDYNDGHVRLEIMKYLFGTGIEQEQLKSNLTWVINKECTEPSVRDLFDWCQWMVRSSNSKYQEDADLIQLLLKMLIKEHYCVEACRTLVHLGAHNTASKIVQDASLSELTREVALEILSP